MDFATGDGLVMSQFSFNARWQTQTHCGPPTFDAHQLEAGIAENFRSALAGRLAAGAASIIPSANSAREDGSIALDQTSPG
jgi:hypothetical protein